MTPTDSISEPESRVQDPAEELAPVPTPSGESPAGAEVSPGSEADPAAEADPDQPPAPAAEAPSEPEVELPAAVFDVASLGDGDLGVEAFFALFEEIYADESLRRGMQRVLCELRGEQAGLAAWILGRREEAEELLAKARNRSEAAEYCFADCLLHKGELTRAAQTFEKLAKTYPGQHRHRAGILRTKERAITPGDEKSIQPLEKAFAKLDEEFAQSADGAYFAGRIAEFKADYDGAIECYERAIESNPRHREARWRLAYQLDLHGMDEEAFDHFFALSKMPPVSSAVLANLGLLLEDREEYEASISCFEAILREDPTNLHARLHLKDVLASRVEQYDEDLEKKEDKLQQILRIPITDFELSVRARNCLNRMEIRTLGHLVKKTEAELLSYKNFGETSLNEIKDILRANGLRLGMERDDGTIDASKLRTNEDEDKVSQDAMEIPIGELQLSVRSRRTVDRIGCKTVGELAARSEAELLAQPNFGHTSLNEIKHKLEALGLSLAKR